jgi:cephalosporin hydroxylase
MRYTFDTDLGILTLENGDQRQLCDLYSRESFDALNRLWRDVGWVLRFSYQFTWLGRPIIQLPADIIRYQELIWRQRPDIIIETGVAHGGSLLFAASLCRLLSKGRVVGIDIEIRPQNRAAILTHALAPLITLVEGSSIEPLVVQQVRAQVKPGETVLALLDSGHTKAHVLAELEAYASLVTPGSYIVVADGVMRDLAGVPGAGSDWDTNNPAAAAREFLDAHPEFRLECPDPIFRESPVVPPTYWVDGFLRRVR